MKSFNKLAVLGAVLALSSSAFATSLTPGGSVTASSLSVTGVTEISTTINGTITTGTFSATYATGVFSDTNNVYCSGCLDFIYQFSNGGPDTIERATMTNFDSFLTNVGYNNATGTAQPGTVTRNLAGDIAFNFTGVATGTESELLIIETNATSYTTGFFSLQDGTAGSGAAFAPTATPEPSSLMLMGSGLVSAAGMFIRRRRVNA